MLLKITSLGKEPEWKITCQSGRKRGKGEAQKGGVGERVQNDEKTQGRKSEKVRRFWKNVMGGSGSYRAGQGLFKEFLPVSSEG